MEAYISNVFPASRKACFECKCHGVLVLKVCGKHSNFYLFSVYRNPNANDHIFDCLLNNMAVVQENYRKAAFLFVGDFHAIDFSTESGCDQLIHRPTHKSGNTLDLIFTDDPGVV